MADRRVAVAEETEEIVIDHVSVLNKIEQKGDPSDPFARKAEELKAYTGTSPAFKRRVSTQLKKFYRGQDGAESKQITDDTFIDGYDTFEVMQPPYNLDYLAKLYETSSQHYAAVNAKVANIVGLGYMFVETAKTKRALERVSNDKAKTQRARRNLDAARDGMLDMVETFNEEDTFTEILVKVWRDYEVTGNGYLEVGRKKDGTIGYIGHIPASTMRIRRKRDGFVQMTGFKVQFFANFGAGIDENKEPQPINNPIGGGRPNEVIHIKKYSPTNTYYGIPDIVAALQAVAGNEFASRFNLDYFENKAVPRYAIILKGAKLGAQAESRLLSFFETGLKGQNHRSVYIPLPADTAENKVDLQLKAIEAGVQDSSFNNYRKANTSDILMAHRVPITKISISEGASIALAKDADKTFKEQVCAPEQRIFEKKLNKIIREFTDAHVLKLTEMTLTDENTQSQIEERRRKTGVETANEQRARRGDPAIEGGDTLFDMNAKAAPSAGTTNSAGTEATTNRERDATRSANATDSAGNARNAQGEGRTTQ